MIHRSERTEQGRTRSQSKFENNRPNNERCPLIQKYPFDIPGVSIAYCSKQIQPLLFQLHGAHIFVFQYFLTKIGVELVHKYSKLILSPEDTICIISSPSRPLPSVILCDSRSKTRFFPLID